MDEQLRVALHAAFGADGDAATRTGSFAEWSVLSSRVAPVLLDRHCRVVAISGSQGSGKSTLAATLTDALSARGCRAVSVSLDDFYLTRRERQALARKVHPLLATRGVPGTHDVAWLHRVIAGVADGETEVSLPRFDKGLDDRSGSETVAVDLLVLEGWCVGVAPQPAAALAEPVNDLERFEDPAGVWRGWVNEQINCQYFPLWASMEFWLHLRAPDFDVVHTWRGDAERQLPAARRMSDAALSRFIAHYERLTRWQLACPARGPGVLLALDAEHHVTGVAASAGAEI